MQADEEHPSTYFCLDLLLPPQERYLQQQAEYRESSNITPTNVDLVAKLNGCLPLGCEPRLTTSGHVNTVVKASRKFSVAILFSHASKVWRELGSGTSHATAVLAPTFLLNIVQYILK